MASEEVEGTIDKAKGALDGGGDGVLGALKSKELITSAALSAAGAIAAAKGPDLVRRLASKTEEKSAGGARKLGEQAAQGAKESISGGNGAGGLVGKAASKLLPGGGGGGGGKGKKTRRLPIQRWTDVAVPVDKAYEAWIKFDQYPQFMHRVLSVEKKGRDTVSWDEKIWFKKRHWEGKITDRRKNDRIAWKTTSGMTHKGVVSFHKLDSNLTRVMVDMEFEPSGMFEKMASGLRFVKRAVQADLARFKAYVEMDDAKGLEYSASRGGQDEDQDGDNENEDKDGQEEPRDADEATSRDNDEDASDGNDEEERDSARQQRQTRRRQRAGSR